MISALKNVELNAFADRDVNDLYERFKRLPGSTYGQLIKGQRATLTAFYRSMDECDANMSSCDEEVVEFEVEEHAFFNRNGKKMRKVTRVTGQEVEKIEKAALEGEGEEERKKKKSYKKTRSVKDDDDDDDDDDDEDEDHDDDDDRYEKKKKFDGYPRWKDSCRHDDAVDGDVEGNRKELCDADTDDDTDDDDDDDDTKKKKIEGDQLKYPKPPPKFKCLTCDAAIEQLSKDAYPCGHFHATVIDDDHDDDDEDHELN